MSFYSIADFIKKYYPDYYGIQTYSIAQCVAICKVKDDWGLFSNFAHTPLEVDGITFESSEELFQLMKFKDSDVIQRIRVGITINDKTCHQIKMTAKSYEKTYRRLDWGLMILDAMKFCLTIKYEQSAEFRDLLQASAGKYIVEDQTTMPKKHPDAWGVKAIGGNYVGPNLLGRLLMELRDNGTLHYCLPDDALSFIGALKSLDNDIIS